MTFPSPGQTWRVEPYLLNAARGGLVPRFPPRPALTPTGSVAAPRDGPPRPVVGEAAPESLVMQQPGVRRDGAEQAAPPQPAAQESDRTPCADVGGRTRQAVLRDFGFERMVDRLLGEAVSSGRS